MNEQLTPGLHVVATPIGNLGDLSPRAADTLKRADRILAEDTRVTAKLLAHIGAKTPMLRYDDHTSEADRERIVAMLGEQAIALVSDALSVARDTPTEEPRFAGLTKHGNPISAVTLRITLAGLLSH